MTERCTIKEVNGVIQRPKAIHSPLKTATSRQSLACVVTWRIHCISWPLPGTDLQAKCNMYAFAQHMGRPSQRLVYLLSSTADCNEIEGIGGTRRRSIDSKWLPLKFQRPTAGVKIQRASSWHVNDAMCHLAHAPPLSLVGRSMTPGSHFKLTSIKLHRASSLVDSTLDGKWKFA